MPSTAFCIERDFLGMVDGLQGYNSLSQFSAENYIGSVVALSLPRYNGINRHVVRTIIILLWDYFMTSVLL
ncbi:MAG: hypothetical protein ACXWX7_16810 [Candidatus Binatia bacterium]